MARIRLALPVTLVFILIFTAACGGKTAAPPNLPQSATQKSDQPASPGATSTPVKVPAAPYTLASLYDARVSSGEWTAGEALVQLLGMYTGSTKADQVLGSAQVSDFELTGLIDLADQYLAENPSGAIHDELLKQVNMLIAPEDKLLLFSREGNLRSQGDTHLASLTQPSHSLKPLADVTRCQQLWADGFDSIEPVPCFLYDTVTVAGTQIRIFYPDWWPSSDSRLVRIEPMLAAAELAVRKFNGLSPNPLPPVTLVVTELLFLDPETSRRDANVMAFTKWRTDPDLKCYVGLFPGMFNELNQDQDQQIVAHEMFHCYQGKNLMEQSRGPLRAANRWWVEGSAEYFGNFVYPSVNYEHQWLSRLTAAMLDGTSLTTWEYKANFFFQYLENRPDVGIPGILRLLQSMPTAYHSNNNAQLAALSAYPNINLIFHQFVQSVADQNVIDSNGAVIPLVVPVNPSPITEPSTAPQNFGPQPFTVDIRNIIFPEHFDYTLSNVVEGSPGQASMRKSATPQAWVDIPSRVEANCGIGQYVLVVSQTGPNDENSYNVRLSTTAAPGTELCSCLVGSWKMDNTSYLTHLNGLMLQSAPGLVKYTAVTGSVVVEFTSGGLINQSIEALSLDADMSVTGLPIQQMVILMEGNSTAGYLVNNNAVSFTSVESHLSISTTLNGSPLNTGTPSDYLSSGPLGTGAGYVCSENTLTLTPTYPTYTNLPPLTFTKEP